MVLTTILRALSRLWTQLNSGSGTEGKDCGALACINLIVWASHGKVGPKSQDELAHWVKQVRAWAGNPDRPMMVENDIFQVLNSKNLAHAFSSAGLPPPKAWYNYGKGWGDLRTWLHQSDDHAVMLAINYGVARRNGAPMGSSSFNGGHAIVMTGMQQLRVKIGRKYRLRWFTMVGDPLMDGRRKPASTARYPKGWIKARYYFYRKAAGAFGSNPDGSPRPIGDGHAICVTVVRGS